MLLIISNRQVRVTERHGIVVSAPGSEVRSPGFDSRCRPKPFSLIFGRISATSYLDNVMVAKGETDIIDFAKLKPSTLSIVDQFVKSTLPSSTKTAQNQKVKDKKSKIKAEIEEMPARECFRHGLVVRKKLCCLEKPVASQVILQKTLSNSKRLKAVVQKIALQINCKLGGQRREIVMRIQRLENKANFNLNQTPTLFGMV